METLEEIIKTYQLQGFSKYSPGILYKNSKCLLQKAIRNEDNKLKYYCNIYVCNMTHFKEGFQATCEVQFYKDEMTFNITILEVSSPEEAIKICDEFWNNMKFDFDHHND